MTASFAFKADIRAEADHHPFIGTTRMRLAQTQKIVELKIGKHEVSFKSAVEECVERLYRAASHWRRDNL